MTFAKKNWVWVIIGLVAVIISIYYLISLNPEESDLELETQTGSSRSVAASATPQSQATQPDDAPQAQPPPGLTISNVQSVSSVSQYDKYEVRFAIDGTVATNLQWPYDPGPVSGMAAESLRSGITVDGLFLPPGQTDWAEALVQPAFLFQPYLTDRKTIAGTANSEWIYPAGEAYWLVRFAPKQSGAWQFKIRAQDDSNYPAWRETGVMQFTVDNPRPGVHGFVQVSNRDGRYFEYSDGTPYTGTGINASDRGIYHAEQQAEAEFRDLYAVGKLNLARAWMDMELVFSRGTHEWDAWRSVTGTADDLRTTEEVFADHDFSIKLAGDRHYIFQASNGNQRLAGGLEAGKRYILRVTANLGSTPAADLVVRLISGPENFETILQALGPDGEWAVIDLGDGWKRYEAVFTNSQGRLLFKGGTALSVGVTSGTAYLDEVYIGEDLGGGMVGPNVVFKGKLNYHQYFDPIASANWDLIFEHAAAYGLALKVVISDKQDLILGKIRLMDGVFDPSIGINSENFHSQRGYKARRLQEYYWRYLAARWGYALGVHSWELLNEGDPGSDAHRDQAVHLAQVMETLDHNHMGTTSFWSGFPGEYWGEARSQGVGYADVHAYVSSGAAISPGMTDDPAIESDSVAYHIAYSQATREKITATGGEMPVVRGEAGIDTFEGQREQAELAEDLSGVWLHNFVWAMLHPGGLYELYWWSDNIRTKPGPDGNAVNGLFEIFAPYNGFMANIPLNGGGYVDLGVNSPANTRVVGQQNNGGQLSDRAHLWIANLKHTWKNVVDGMDYGNLVGTVMLTGMAPEADFAVEWWDFNSQGELRIRSETVRSDASGQIRFEFSLPAINGLPVTDTAVKIGNYEQ